VADHQVSEPLSTASARDEAAAMSASADGSGRGPAAQELPPRLSTYCQALYEEFHATARAGNGPVDKYYDLAGVRVLLRLAAPPLAPLARALAHRSASSGDATLTVCAWEGGSTPAPIPPVGSASEWSARSRPGQDGGYSDKQIRGLYVGTIGALSMLDAERRRALFRARGPGAVSSAESAAPFLHIFTWWLARHERYLVHAGAVGTAAGGVLLAGKGGAGKSTTALACLDSELLHAGDDYVLLSATPAPFAYSLYQSAKLHADQLWRLPQLAVWARNLDRLNPQKVLVFLNDGYAHKLTSGFPIRAILLPRVTGRRESRLLPAPTAQTLDALIPTSVVELPGLGHEGVRAIARIVRSVPSYVLEAGTDLAQIPTIILDLLQRR
jgi:hypothetical protein